MKGIKITSSDINESFQIDSGNYSMTFMLSLKHFQGQEQLSIHLSGFDKDKNEDVKWFDQLIEPNRKIILEVIDGKEVISPKEIEKREESFIDKQKLETYLFLQRELKEKGLI